MRILDCLEAFGQSLIGQMERLTIENYVRIMTRFAHWLDPDDAEVSDLHTDLVDAYRIALVARGLKPKTVSLELSAIRRFCRWCVAQRLLLTDPTLPIVWPKMPHTLPRALSSRELDALHAALIAPCKQDAKSVRLWARNRRAIYVMLYAGLRIAEAAALDWGAVDFHARTLTVYDGKGGKDRSVPLHPVLMAELERVPPDARYGAVCGQKYGEPVGPKGLGHVFERWLPQQGVDGISAHRLRHTCATLMRRYGADLLDIQQILGHESLSTTQRYLGADPEQLRRAIDRLPAPNDKPVLRLVV